MNTILFNKYTGDVYKVIQNKLLMLGWDIMGPFWDFKSNFENQDSNMKEEECFIIDEKDLYINRFNGFISYYEEDYYNIWKSNNGINYEFSKIEDIPNMNPNNLIQFKYITDYSINYNNTDNIFKKSIDMPKTNIFYNKFERHFSTRKELDEYAIMKLESIILKNKDKLSNDQLDLLLSHVCECLYH